MAVERGANVTAGVMRSRRRSERSVSRASLVAVIVILVAVSAPAGSVGATHLAPRAHAASSAAPSIIDCNGGIWRSTHLEVGTNGCQALFSVNYAQDFDNWSASDQYNFSFSIPWVAEFSTSGAMVRLADPLSPMSASTNVSSSPGEVNISLVEGVNVTTVAGNWTPNDSWSGTGPQWMIGSTPVGTVTVAMVFHLENVTPADSTNTSLNASNSLKFDVNIAGWPWASSVDELGFGLESLAAGGAHFAFDAASQSLAEAWNATNGTYASLAFGPNATVSPATEAAQNASVHVDTGLFFAGSADRQAVSLVNFTGVAGGYPSISYDPWVIFQPGVLPGGQVPSNKLPGGTIVEAGALAAAVAGTSAVVLVTNRWRLRREGETLYADMRAAADTSAEPSDHAK